MFCPYCSCKQDEETIDRIVAEKEAARREQLERDRHHRETNLQKGISLLNSGNLLQDGKQIYNCFSKAKDDYYVALCLLKGIGVSKNINGALTYLSQDLEKAKQQSCPNEEIVLRDNALQAECYSMLASEKAEDGLFQEAVSYLNKVHEIRKQYGADLTDEEKTLLNNCNFQLEHIEEEKERKARKMRYLTIAIFVSFACVLGGAMWYKDYSAKQKQIMEAYNDSVMKAQKDSAETARREALNEKAFRDSIKMSDHLTEIAEQLNQNPLKFVVLTIQREVSKQCIYYLKIEKDDNDTFDEYYTAKCYINKYDGKGKYYETCYSISNSGYFKGRPYIKVHKTSSEEKLLLEFNNGLENRYDTDAGHCLALLHLNVRTGNAECEYYHNVCSSFENIKGGYRILVAQPEMWSDGTMPYRYISFNKEGYEQSRSDIFYK